MISQLICACLRLLSSWHRSLGPGEEAAGRCPQDNRLDSFDKRYDSTWSKSAEKSFLARLSGATAALARRQYSLQAFRGIFQVGDCCCSISQSTAVIVDCCRSTRLCSLPGSRAQHRLDVSDQSEAASVLAIDAEEALAASLHASACPSCSRTRTPSAVDRWPCCCVCACCPADLWSAMR